ncbi:hypothetical protein [Streptomyces griseus]|uniref:hypothetical protein n=1 Tax=Streptomyces griseus TaxID=1911 RepID=UPI00068D2441|nr:hypothetical protein [Streptomyces griseus]
MNDIRTRADALIAAGRPAEARTAAREALDENGPDAGLFLALARAHMAEDDDDHDDAAERVFREGLDAFPDDVGLLGGYAVLCARTDGFERPGRRARGEEVLARLREIAPNSPELLRAESAGSSVAADEKDGASVRRMQSFDAARALADAPSPEAAAAQAARWAAAAPHDRRLAVLAETTAALAAPGRARLRFLLLRRLEYRFTAVLLLALLVILRLTVLPGIPFGVAAGAGLLPHLPFLGLRKLLRAARDRAALRMTEAVAGPGTGAEPGAGPGPEPVAGDGAGSSAGAVGFGAPELPPVPRVTRREYAFAGAGAALLLLVGGAAYASSVAYPRYDVVAHDEYRGLTGYELRAKYDPFRNMRGRTPARSAAWVYVGKDAARNAPAEYLVAVAAGDFHDIRESDVRDARTMEALVGPLSATNEVWAAGAGPYGGWMQCARYTEPSSGTRRSLCAWADRGSFGLVALTAGDGDRAEVEAAARSVGADFLRPAAG